MPPQHCVKVFIFTLITSILSFVSSHDRYEEELGHLRPLVDAEIQSRAVEDLIKRITPERADEFVIEIDPNLRPDRKDCFHLTTTDDDKIKITATTGVVAATAFNIYLKYYCVAHISWDSSQLSLPKVLPKVNLTKTLNDRFRYYQNVCTTSYSFVWWNWEQWERHIDWMALNSINLVLAFTGQEAIWKRVYLKFNLTEDEINEQFTGPAFLSWERMGNVRRWGGPLTDNWHNRTLKLQSLILARMREIGIIPVLPAFSGYVPEAIKRIYPNAKLTQVNWSNFNSTYLPFLLDPSDPLFKTIGTTFMAEMIKEFGTNHIYNCDAFNEVVPPSTEPDYLSNAGKTIFATMTAVDAKAVWVMQNWMLVHDFLYWTKERAKALITSVPRGRMIILDLQSEQFPQYERFDNYFDQPYIWCMLHNFGGTLGMYGSVDIINRRPFEARKSSCSCTKTKSTMVGTGLTPEGINQNYAIYELMAEMAWYEKPVSLDDWFVAYSRRRYGNSEDNVEMAWKILMSTVYNFTGSQLIRGKYTINRSPSKNIQVRYWYNVCDVYESWDYFIRAAEALGNNLGYQHDLVDLTRQVLQLSGDNIYQNMMYMFLRKDIYSFNNSMNEYLSLFDDLENILSTNKQFLLGQWLNSAVNASDNKQDAKLFYYNAKNQITLWGPNGEIKDYANKQWAGVVKDYFKPRWEYFLNKMLKAMVQHKSFNQAVVKKEIFENIEKPFTFDFVSYPEEPIGNTVAVAKGIHKRWWPKIKC